MIMNTNYSVVFIDNYASVGRYSTVSGKASQSLVNISTVNHMAGNGTSPPSNGREDQGGCVTLVAALF